MSWPMVKLDDLFDIARGGSPRPIQNFITDDTDGINWISISDASNSSKYIEKTKKRIIKEGMKKSRLVKSGDFLLTNSMSFGRPYIMKTSGCIHDGWLVLSPKYENIDTDYFYHLLGSTTVYNHFCRVAAGAVVKNLNIDLVKVLEIPLPPLPEQKRIATILDKADSLRRKNQQAIQLADQFLRAVFLELFGDPVTNSMGWNIFNLSELCNKITDGTHHSPPITESGVPYITAKHLKQTGLEFYNDPWYISPDSHKGIYSRCNPVKGDVLYIKDGATTGLAAINEYDFEFSMLSSLALLKPNGDLMLPEYLTMFLNHPRSKSIIIANMAGAAITRLTLAKIKEIRIPIPPVDLQQKFSFIYWNVKVTLEKTRNCTAFSDDEFNVLSQKAFAGEL